MTNDQVDHYLDVANLAKWLIGSVFLFKLARFFFKANTFDASDFIWPIVVFVVAVLAELYFSAVKIQRESPRCQVCKLERR